MALIPRGPRLRRVRRARRRLDRRTLALGAGAAFTTGSVLGAEVARVWRRGRAPLPTETDDILGAAEEAVSETVAVVREGYREVSERENALLNLLLSSSLAFLTIRGITHVIRVRGVAGPFRDVTWGERHIHHFVPGIVLAFVSGGASIVTRNETLDKWLAVPFGVGAALTLDESALLLELDDVYWTEKGVVSVQITLAAIGMLGALALALRMLRRGEQVVLEGGPGG